MQLLAGFLLATFASVLVASDFSDRHYPQQFDPSINYYNSPPPQSYYGGDQSRYVPNYDVRPSRPRYADRPQFGQWTPEQNVFGSGDPTVVSRPVVSNTFGRVPGPVPSFSPPGLYHEPRPDSHHQRAFSYAPEINAGPYGYPDNPYMEPYGEDPYPVTEFDYTSGPFGYGVGPGYGPAVDPAYFGFE